MVAAQRYQHFHIEGVSIAAGKATREVVMPLRLGHTLKGRVFDQASGAGIGDAWIAFRDASVPWPNPDPTRNRHEKSKDDGTFVLDGVPGGDMIVTATAKDHAWGEVAVTVNENTPPVQIGLATGGKIAGMVVAPDGTPAKGRLMLAGPGIPWSSADGRNRQLRVRAPASRALPADRQHSVPAMPSSNSSWGRTKSRKASCCRSVLATRCAA